MQRKFASFKHILFPDTGCAISGNMFVCLILWNITDHQKCDNSNPFLLIL